MFFGRIEFTGGPKVMKKQMNAITQDCLELAAMTWHKLFRPIHFTREAMNRYGYRQRSDKYVQRKIRQKGHADPLVFTGETRRRAEQMNLTSNSRRATGVLPVPKYITSFHGGKHAAELTKVLKKEERELARGFQAHATKLLNNLREHETVKF